MSTSDASYEAGKISLAIANLSVEINCNHRRLAELLRERYRDFATSDQTTNFTADIHWIGKDRQNALLDVNPNFQEGVLHFSAPGYEGFVDEKRGKGSLTLSSAQPIEEIDYFVRTVFALLAHAADGVLLHAAGIVRNKQAYLFFGHSGSGKTTVCRVSQNNHTILNDDLILLLPQENIWCAYGTPFWNPTQVQPSAQSAPVKEMFLLIQAKQVFKKSIAAGHAIAALIANVPVIPQDPDRSRHLVETLLDIQRSIPVSELHFLPDNSFWHVVTS